MVEMEQGNHQQRDEHLQQTLLSQANALEQARQMSNRDFEADEQYGAQEAAHGIAIVRVLERLVHAISSQKLEKKKFGSCANCNIVFYHF